MKVFSRSSLSCRNNSNLTASFSSCRIFKGSSRRKFSRKISEQRFSSLFKTRRIDLGRSDRPTFVRSRKSRFDGKTSPNFSRFGQLEFSFTFQRTTSSYVRLAKGLELLLEFFSKEEFSLPKEILKTDKFRVRRRRHSRPERRSLFVVDFQIVKKLVKYHSMDTRSLIKLYYHEKLNEQERFNQTNHFGLGRIFSRAYYHPKEETLYVESEFNLVFSFTERNDFFRLEVVACKSLKPCDSNGLR